ncbi:MAG: tyrosine-type recombinase/integrase [Planctomycetota bacterium]|jgi:integrase
MRTFRTTYKARDGRTKTAAKWYIEIRDHLGTTRRFAAFSDRAQSEALGRQIERLVACRIAGEQPGAALSQWLEQIPAKLKDRLVQIGLLDSARVASARPLAAHLEDYRQSLLAKGRTRRYVREIVAEIDHVFRNCGFVFWSDISAHQMERYLAGLRDGGKGISARTFNGKLKAVKGFVAWMIRNRRAADSPISHLTCLNEKADRRRVRRPLGAEEVRRLLTVAENGPERYGMTGHARMLLYRLACESGLRANELRNLTAASFDFANLTVTTKAPHSKSRNERTLPLRPDTAEQLKDFVSGKLPACRVFNMPSRKRTPEMLRADLAEAGIPYVDSADRFADFHSLRHTTASLLAASGTHPRVAQSIMRHADINLTMNAYTHVLRGQESEAVGGLPDFSVSRRGEQKATGTDDSVLASCLAPSGGKQRSRVDDNGQTQRPDTMQGAGQNRRSSSKNAVHGSQSAIHDRVTPVAQKKGTPDSASGVLLMGISVSNIPGCVASDMT